MKSDVLSPELPQIRGAEPLGQGSTGEVLLVELAEPWLDFEAGHQLAIKRLLPNHWGDQPMERAFVEEGRLGLSVQHEGLVSVLATGYRPSEGAPEIVMEWIPGETLDELLASGTCPEPLLRSLGQRLAGALGQLHHFGFAHADIKPENIRLDANGQARLLDLGFATPFDPTDEHPEPLDHDPGSPLWMAPERLAGAAPSFASDVYSLGLVLYSGATGSMPNHQGSRLVKPSSLLPRLTPFFDELIGEMLSSNPADRPTTAEIEVRLGKGEASTWWQAQIAGLGEASASRPRASGPLTSLIEFGRKKELAQLAKFSGMGAKEQPPISPLLLRGEDGSGKWELVHEFAARARRSPKPPLFLSGRTDEMAEARPYGTLFAILRTWLGFDRSNDVTASHRQRLSKLLSPKSAGTLIGVLDASADERIEGSVLDAFAEWVLALSEKTHTILFVDQLQSAGEETLRALFFLAKATAGNPNVFLIFGERDDLAQRPNPRLEAASSQRMDLQPLTESCIAAIVAASFDKSTPRLRLSKVLMNRSQGNPALLYELLLGLEETGATRPVAGKLHLLIDPERVPVPSSLQATIRERFARLDRAHRSALVRMAVLGGHLSPETIVRAFGQRQDEDLGAIITSLSRQRWLVARGDHFSFARPALREAVLTALAAPTRRRLHAKAAAGLAPKPGERASVGSGIRRAWHLREAGELKALLACLRSLIRSLIERGQPQRVGTLSEWGLEALTAIEREEALSLEQRHLRLALLEQAADSANRLGARERERQLLDSLADLDVDTDKDPFRTARIYLLYGRHARDTGAYGMARGLLLNAHKFAEDAGRPLLVARTEALLAEVLAESGDLEGAHAHGQKSWRIAKGAAGIKGQGSVLAGAALTRAHITVLQGKPDRALLWVDRALTTLRKSSTDIEPGLRARAHLLRARIWRDLGRPGRARGSAQKARELSRLAHERVLEAESVARLGGLFVDIGEMERAEENLREALLISREIEDKRGMCLAQVWLGTLLSEAGDSGAASALESSAKLADEIGLHRCGAMARALGARVQLTQGKLDEAHQLVGEAQKMLASQGAELRDRIVITGTWALIQYLTGDAEEATQAVKDLRRTMRSASGRIEDPALSKLHRRQTTRLLDSVLSAEGPLYPRSDIPSDRAN